MPADSELEKLRSDLAHVDALAKPRADLAAVDVHLKWLDDPALGPPGAVLFYRRYYQREREKIILRIDLLELPRKIEICKRNYEIASSPGERLRHKKHCQMIQQGRALGRSRQTSLPSDPQVAAQKSLTEVSGKFRQAKLRLQELTTSDAEWAEFLRSTAPPVCLATEAQAPAIARGGNAGRTPAGESRPNSADKSTHASFQRGQRGATPSPTPRDSSAPKSTQDGDGAAKLNTSETTAVDIRAAAPGAAEVKILVDTLATPAEGARVVKAALRKKGLPYRAVKDYEHIVKAVEY